MLLTTNSPSARFARHRGELKKESYVNYAAFKSLQ